MHDAKVRFFKTEMFGLQAGSRDNSTGAARSALGKTICSTWRGVFVALSFALLLLIPNAGEAKSLAHRLGIGFKNQFSTSLPGLAVQYYPGAALGLSAVFAIDTLKDNSRFGMMAKVHRVIFEEDNLNFYMGAGAGILSQQNSGKTDSGFELMGFAGAEFFFAGLENLGFSFETGMGVTSVSSQVRFRTIGDSPLRAGIIFYF